MSAAEGLIIFVGYRCTGKTTIAQVLAGHMGWPWLDLDPLLEARAGRTIRELFETEGETGFRARESVLLRELCGLKRHVLATGGGVVLAPANRQCLRAAGKVIWLRADAATIHERMAADPNTVQRRPALTVGGLPEIQELLAHRHSLYGECAHWAVDTQERTPEELAAHIMDWLQVN